MSDQSSEPASARRSLRVLVAKPGLDGHDRGAKVVARGLREAGVDVIYSGLHRTPEEIAEMALNESVDAVGLSVLSGAHVALVRQVAQALRDRGAGHVVILVGGTIPADDVPLLRELGVDAVFGPGASLREIGECLEASVARMRRRSKER